MTHADELLDAELHGALRARDAQAVLDDCGAPGHLQRPGPVLVVDDQDAHERVHKDVTCEPHDRVSWGSLHCSCTEAQNTTTHCTPASRMLRGLQLQARSGSQAAGGHQIQNLQLCVAMTMLVQGVPGGKSED